MAWDHLHRRRSGAGGPGAGAKGAGGGSLRDNLLGIHLGLPHGHPGGWSRLTSPALEWSPALHRYEEGLDPAPWRVTGHPPALAGNHPGLYDLVLLDLPMGPVPELPCGCW